MPLLGTTALLDANVLYPSVLRDFLLRLAAAQFFSPCWSADIHEEWIENLLENNPALSRQRLEITRQKMDAYFPGALIAGYEPLIPQLTNDPKDRHVLAAAIQGNAAYIVTRNLRDFQKPDLASYGIVALSPDDFAIRLYQEAPADMAGAIRRHREQLRSPARTPEEYLEDLLRNHLPQTAAALQRRVGDL